MDNQFTAKVYSFGYNLSGIPEDTSGHGGGFVFDCRFLPNPGREERFKNSTGKDQEVIGYLENCDVVGLFLKNVFEIVELAVNSYKDRGFTHLMVSFGCTGGQHRSVYCAEKLSEFLKNKKVNVIVKHVELERGIV